MKRPVPALVLAALVLGCGSSQPAPAPASDPSTPMSTQMSTKMADHFTAIVRVQKAVTRGELDVAKRHAGEFTTQLRNADHPEGWQPYLQDVRSALFAVVRADDLTVAASATARAGRACGACHDALGIEAMPAGSKPPMERPESLSEYMWQHMWASESMWNGLVGPSGDAWSEGATALARAGLFPESEAMTDEMKALAIRVNQLGSQALTTEGARERAALYGDFLAACASCHQLYIKDVD